jgi:hypothetical protein
MVPVFLLLTVSGTTTYIWLTSIVAPLWSGIVITARAVRGDGWWAAFPLAFGGAALSTTALATIVLILAINAPASAVWIAQGQELSYGLAVGAAVWGMRAALLGVPRFSRGVETEMALAIAVLAAANADVLRRIERRFAAELSPSPSSARYSDVPGGGRLEPTSSQANSLKSVIS